MNPWDILAWTGALTLSAVVLATGIAVVVKMITSTRD